MLGFVPHPNLRATSADAVTVRLTASGRFNQRSGEKAVTEWWARLSNPGNLTLTLWLTWSIKTACSKRCVADGCNQSNVMHRSSIAYIGPFIPSVRASLLANSASLPPTAPFTSKLAPTRERMIGYARCKHGLSFWDYRKDQEADLNVILSLTDLVRQAATP